MKSTILPVLIPALILLTALSAPATAQNIDDASKFDLNKDGVLDKKERHVLSLHAESDLFRLLDKKPLDGVISPDELQAEVAKAEETAADNDRSIAKANPTWVATPPTVDVFVAGAPEVWFKPPPTDYDPLWGFQIRRSLADIDLNAHLTKENKEEYIKSLQKAKAAEFGYVHNGIDGDESWFARGVVARPFRLGDGLDAWLIVPSIGFDRVNHSVKKKEDVDTLTHTLSLAKRFDGGGPLDGLDISAGGQYATNFDYNGGLYGAHLDIEPYFDDDVLWEVLNNGNFNTFRKSQTSTLQYRTRQFIHLEGGGAEGEAAENVDDSYFRAGAGAGIDFRFVRKADDPLSRLVLSVEYRYFADVLGNDSDYDNFKTALQWQIDEVGHIVLQASYEYGEIPLTMQEVDLFSLSLGVRF